MGWILHQITATWKNDIVIDCYPAIHFVIDFYVKEIIHFFYEYVKFLYGFHKRFYL